MRFIKRFLLVFCSGSVEIVFDVSANGDDTRIDAMGEALEVTTEDIGY